jgi:chromosome segregation protein
MRLTKIKLAGFKSFVEPTTLHLPSNLVGIVGPNGCGKSNVIDAVRWVMGESSARTLRGESMADVIFNGSATRKPVGQATIELVFDNSQGRLTGPWAQYNEISIRRQLSRDGQSQYFLNGTRCRRRDITDIFLGTGLGPRSYAIIEQGMISRIIEAKPEELRIFFEEAAGISKYKERRRETELRIQHTRENLDRLTDLREELARQLQHLQRQAQAAEQYQQYKETERRLKAELLALRWRILDADISRQEWGLREQETALEAVVAEQRKLETRLTIGREQQAKLNESLNQAQGRYYEVGASISRLEQYLEHQRELRHRQDQERRQTEQTLAQVLKQLQLDQTRLAELEQSLAEAEPTLAAARADEAEADAQLAGAEAAMHEWQVRWEHFSQRTGESHRQAEVERTRIEQLERQLLQQERRLERLRLEQDSLADAGILEELEALHPAEQAAAEALATMQQALAEVEAGIADRRQRQRQLTAELHATQEQVQSGRGRLASLEALQEAALGRRDSAVNHWLKARELEQAPRLAECLSVASGWEQAAETVLGEHLEAVCVPGLDTLAVMLHELEEGHLRLFDITANTIQPEANPALADKVQAPWPLTGLLAGVQLAGDLNEALLRRSELADWESLVTPDGAWLGRDWLQVRRSGDETRGILAREQEIQALHAALHQDVETVRRHTATLEQLHADLYALEQERGTLQETVNQGHREHARLQERLDALSTRLEQALARRDAVREEQEELLYQVEQDRETLQASRLQLEEALLIMEQLTAERQTLIAQRDSLRGQLETCRTRAGDARRHAQQQALAVESLRTGLASTRQALERLHAQQLQLQARREQLTMDLSGGTEPLETAHAQLEELLGNRIEAEEALGSARRAVEDQDAELRSLEQARTERERQAQAVRQTLEAQRLTLGEINVRRQTLVEQLQELNVELTTVLATLPSDAAEPLWQDKLEKLTARIQRLGPINLAAIEEFAQLSERKRYLDAQNDDLVEALTTLENAIRKIDRETRSQLKDTFERVNAGLQTLFPRLFGGGQAYLELTGDDVLDAGIAIMARPPGKRIGNIHLLSGGEKALAAVALVFAIFQLNPAPFCLLDEVDAPLDEANVGRFGELVREMSEHVQFIFITHNKGTMEIARHLAGVTMHEPGVSRLVAVDVDEAVRLAAM